MAAVIPRAGASRFDSAAIDRRTVAHFALLRGPKRGSAAVRIGPTEASPIRPLTVTQCGRFLFRFRLGRIALRLRELEKALPLARVHAFAGILRALAG